MHFFLVFKRLEWVDLNEKNSKRMYDKKEESTVSAKKINCPF